MTLLERIRTDVEAMAPTLQKLAIAGAVVFWPLLIAIFDSNHPSMRFVLPVSILITALVGAPSVNLFQLRRPPPPDTVIAKFIEMVPIAFWSKSDDDREEAVAGKEGWPEAVVFTLRLAGVSPWLELPQPWKIWGVAARFMVLAFIWRNIMLGESQTFDHLHTSAVEDVSMLTVMREMFTGSSYWNAQRRADFWMSLHLFFLASELLLVCSFALKVGRLPGPKKDGRVPGLRTMGSVLFTSVVLGLISLWRVCPDWQTLLQILAFRFMPALATIPAHVATTAMATMVYEELLDDIIAAVTKAASATNPEKTLRKARAQARAQHSTWKYFLLMQLMLSGAAVVCGLEAMYRAPAEHLVVQEKLAPTLPLIVGLALSQVFAAARYNSRLQSVGNEVDRADVILMLQRVELRIGTFAISQATFKALVAAGGLSLLQAALMNGVVEDH